MLLENQLKRLLLDSQFKGQIEVKNFKTKNFKKSDASSLDESITESTQNGEFHTLSRTDKVKFFVYDGNQWLAHCFVPKDNEYPLSETQVEELAVSA